MMGIHRSLIQYTRRGILDGVKSPRLASDVRERAERAFSLLEHGLGDYARKPG
jgi:hypothetical protein